MLNKICISVICGILFGGCVEPFEIETTETFESALVIEATITDEEKQQLIRLSRTNKLGELDPQSESGAQVTVVDDVQSQFTFMETDPGVYLSTSTFSAQPNRSYQLIISTNDGRRYASDATELTQGPEIVEVYAERGTNDFGDEGMFIFLNSSDPANNSGYYRYEYEETYKIIAPFWNTLEAIVVNDVFPDYEVGTRLRDQEEQICYNTVISNDIILTSTNGLNGNRVTQFPVRFIRSDNYILSHRYSILVKQFSQSLQAFTFYETLKKFAESENFFSENQPGFLAGNVFSMTDSEEPVLGYFGVSSVSSKRIFFDYTDFYPVEPLPPYATGCTVLSTPLFRTPCLGICDSPLIESIKAERLEFFQFNTEGIGNEPFLMVPRACGDCTALGDNVIPEFWVE